MMDRELINYLRVQGRRVGGIFGSRMIELCLLAGKDPAGWNASKLYYLREKDIETLCEIAELRLRVKELEGRLTLYQSEGTGVRLAFLQMLEENVPFDAVKVRESECTGDMIEIADSRTGKIIWSGKTFPRGTVSAEG